MQIQKSLEANISEDIQANYRAIAKGRGITLSELADEMDRQAEADPLGSGHAVIAAWLRDEDAGIAVEPTVVPADKTPEEVLGTPSTANPTVPDAPVVEVVPGPVALSPIDAGEPKTADGEPFPAAEHQAADDGPSVMDEPAAEPTV